MSHPPAKPSSAPRTAIATPSHSQYAQRTDHHATATGAAPPPQRQNQRQRLQRLRTYLASGLCDASAFAALGCFVSMQTGNSVFLCLGASSLPVGGEAYGWAKSLISIAAFVVGSLCWSRASRAAGPPRPGPRWRAALPYRWSSRPWRRRWCRRVLCRPPLPEIPAWRVPVALLACQSAAQLSTAQLVGVGEVPTVVLMSVYYGLAADAGIFRRSNVHRDRRIAAVVAFFAGAIAGGWLERSKGGIAAALWISAAVKLGITVSWLFWKAEKTGAG